ncbi:efflux RND transporter periplasmic adaptor subunit [Nitrosococcus wardiae]|uniref:Efflux RND transporter periplasmic adaptor subunit n=1 Tax=Nitrosococcus wardiae TaxID=1814290 RepID=A0A4V1AVU6_9GAMM|nr:efflux RND transporter periplasmic adaptor subunit [Nitrosococcus wardiae]QBQ54365.1 efflux RND transporter periplasmic adaptor subunit [Nitrosococcus wardiae]
MSRRLIGLLFILTGISFLVWYLSRPEPIPVNLYTVERGLVEATVVNTRAGTIKACRRAGLSPPAGGQVDQLTVKEGDQVKAGQLLLELWNNDLEAEVQLAEKQAKASTAQAEEACVRARVAEKEAQRLLQLQKRALVSEELVDRAVGDAQARRAACHAAQAGAEVSEAQVTVNHAVLARTLLYAPFDGIVAEVNAELGAFVTPSPTGVPTLPAIDLIDRSCLYVSAPIDEIDAPTIHPGMPTRITLDAFRDRVFPGVVQRVAPYVVDIEKQARTVDVEAEFSRPEDAERLLPGYSADVEVILERHEDVLRVPTHALRAGHRVLLYQPETGRLEKRQIEPGLANWEFTEIQSGLKAGDRIVLSIDREGIEPGALVRPEEKNPPP